MIFRNVAFAWLGFTALAFSQEDYSQWASFKQITLNTTASGANVAGNVANFPVLVRLTANDSDVFKTAATGGADIRFATAISASASTHLNYQIESWDVAAKQAAIWVLVPSILGNNNSQSIFLFWNHASAADSSKGPAVFGVANGFQGVWHLNGSLNDATANANNGVDSGTTDTSGGAIGHGRFFNNPTGDVPNGKYIALGNPASLNFGGAITLEGWVKWIQRDKHRIIVCHGASSTVNFETMLRIGEYKDYRTGSWTTVAHHAHWDSTHLALDSNTWVHLAGVYDGTSWILYHNGAHVADTVDTNGAKVTPGAWRIGGQWANNAPNRHFYGTLDEVRISNVARSADWIKLEFENQKSASTLITVGPTQQETGIRLDPAFRSPKDPKMDRGGLLESEPVLFRPNGKPVDPKGRALPLPVNVP